MESQPLIAERPSIAMMDTLNQFLKLQIWQDSPEHWASACALMIGVFLALLGLRSVVRWYYLRLLKTEHVAFAGVTAEALSRTRALFFLALALFAGLSTLEMTRRGEHALDTMLEIALFWQAGAWMSAAVRAGLERRARRSMPGEGAALGSLGVIGLIARVIIWALVGLLTLANLGVDVTALVAGLGIGGVAVALAMQTILGDVFASLSITFDKPFVLGDFLIIDDFLGSVEFIGIKSTRLRSLNGEEIIISNADLLKSRVRNYGRMVERRVVFTTNVPYDTSVERLERIAPLIREAIESQRDTRFDRSHFAKHAAYSLEFETVYYVLSPDYNHYMDIQHAINLRLHRDFARLAIEFAYPAQKLFVCQVDPPRRAA